MRLAFILLAAMALVPAAATAQTRIAANQSARGELTSGDQRLPRGARADTYVVRLRAGDQASVSVNSREFDTFVIVIGPDGRRFENDDSDLDSGITDSWLQFRVARSGDYRIIVTSYEPDEFGRYDLYVSAFDPRQPAAPSPPAPSPAPPAITERPQVQGGLRAVENAHVARAYLYPDTRYGPYAGNLPFGVILLRRGDEARNRALCNAFVNNLPDPQTVLESDPTANIIATYWLLRQRVPAAGLVDCDVLLANYDYARAQRIRSDYGHANAAGPVFLAIQFDVTPLVAILDLSTQTPGQVAETTTNWFNLVVRPEDDLASIPQPRYVQERERRRGRGLFRRILRFIGRIGESIVCGSSGARPTRIAFVDREIDGLRGTLTRVVGQNAILSLGTTTVKRLFCRRGAN